jgi:hypothetical protein
LGQQKKKEKKISFVATLNWRPNGKISKPISRLALSANEYQGQE